MNKKKNKYFFTNQPFVVSKKFVSRYETKSIQRDIKVNQGCFGGTGKLHMKLNLADKNFVVGQKIDLGLEVNNLHSKKDVIKIKAKLIHLLDLQADIKNVRYRKSMKKVVKKFFVEGFKSGIMRDYDNQIQISFPLEEQLKDLSTADNIFFKSRYQILL